MNKLRKLISPKTLALACCLALIAMLIGSQIHFIFDEMYLPEDEGTFTIGQGTQVFTVGHIAHAAVADFVADGVDDHIQFQQALDALPAQGGKLVVLAGTYNFGAAVSRAIDNVTIQGVGHGTVINRDGVNPVFTAGAQSNWVFRDFKTDAGGITVAAATNWTKQNITIGTDYIAFKSDVAAADWGIPVGRAATFVIAASESSPQSKAQADFVVDGITHSLIIEDCEDAWDELIATGVTSSIDTTDFKAGPASVKLVVDAAVTAGTILATEVIEPLDLSRPRVVELQIRSSIATAAGNLQLLLDDTAKCASPIETLDIPALTANTWTHVTLSMANEVAATTVISVGLKFAVDIGNPTIWLDDIKQSWGDEVEIQAAIDALPAGGGKVMLLEGTFNINPTQTRGPWRNLGIVLRSNITLEGQGRGTLLRVPANLNTRFVTILGSVVNNVQVKALAIDLNGGGPRTCFGITLSTSHSSLIHAVYIFGAVYSENIQLSNTHDTMVSNNVLLDGSDGVGLSFGANRNTLIGNVARNNATEGFDVDNSFDNTIIGNTVSGSRQGVAIWGVDSVRNIVKGNVFTGNRDGVYVYDHASRNIIHGNVISLSGQRGILLVNTSYNIVSNNFVTASSQEADLSFSNILIAGSIAATDYNLIQGNVVQIGNQINRPTIGILVGYWGIKPRNTVVRDNILHNSGAWRATADSGIDTTLYERHSDIFMDILAASTTHVHAAITPDGLEHTNVTSPDVPRNIMIRITNTDGVNPQIPSGGNIVIEGIDAKGRPTSETLVVPATSIPAGGTLDVFGSKAFATVSKVTYYTETNIAITVSVGISDKLGLNNVIQAPGNVYKVRRGTISITIPEVDVANGTVDLSPITTGDDITIWYRSNLNILN